MSKEARLTRRAPIADFFAIWILAFLRHSCFVVSVDPHRIRSDRNTSGYLYALHLPLLSENGENAPFLRRCRDDERSSPGSTVQSFPGNVSLRFPVPSLELRHHHPVYWRPLQMHRCRFLETPANAYRSQQFYSCSHRAALCDAASPCRLNAADARIRQAFGTDCVDAVFALERTV